MLGVPAVWTNAPYGEQRFEQSHLAAEGYQTAGWRELEPLTEDGSLNYDFSLCVDVFLSFLS